MWDSHQWTHLARVTLAFCPPLSVTPLSPTGVASPYGSCLKSSFRQHASTTCWNHSPSNSLPNRIFSLSVPENTQGSCAAYPRLPTMSTLPFSGFNSPKRQWRRVDCREKDTCFSTCLLTLNNQPGTTMIDWQKTYVAIYVHTYVCLVCM